MFANIFLRTPTFFRATLVAVAALAPMLVQADGEYAVSGSAYSIDKNQLLYRELYTPVNENREVTVNYTTPDGKIFATKTLIYSGDPIQPEFELHDKRDNERLAAKFSAGRLVLAYDQEGYKQEKEIMETVGLVVDAGFDAYIQKNWDDLVAGKKMRFRFTLPNKLMAANLQVRQITADKSPLFSADSPATWRYFLLEPANRFASILKDPVHLAYESEGKFLMRYYGRSNLDSNDRGAWDVRIEYEYW
jgi:hypothetical protein